MQRITPLTLLAAFVLTYVVYGLWKGTVAFRYEGILMFAMFFVIAVADQLFRFTLKKLGRIWLIEMFFIIFVILCLWLLKVW